MNGINKGKYDLVIVGGGVTGTALAYVLSRYSDVKKVLILEKNSWVAEVNSNPMNNAQTSHDGGTETNYTLKHALEVQAAATMLRRYALSKNDPLLAFRTHRMVLGVGNDEVRTLNERFREFHPHYPDLSLMGPAELAKIEPMLMKGRDPNEPVCGLVSNEGYMINYQRLAEAMLSDAQAINSELDVAFNVAVDSIRREEEDFVLETNQGRLEARVVVFAAGSYSLYFAQQMGYGTEYAILPVAGSFYSGGNLLKGKVYRVQIPGMPFAAIHGDPDILNLSDTRFGPTTKPLPLMERHRYKTFWDFIKLPLVSVRGFFSMTRILASKKMIGYVIKNTLYDLPVIGPWLFMREVRPIVPTIRYRDLKLRRGAGGIRPQIVDLRTRSLVMGDVTITGDRCIFNTTPSPGASVCLANAKRDAAKVAAFLGGGYRFCREDIDRDLG